MAAERENPNAARVERGVRLARRARRGLSEKFLRGAHVTAKRAVSSYRGERFEDAHRRVRIAASPSPIRKESA
ncbi:hypothetical protein LG3211_4329 [Lysobacter gummosus]|nr:hypothetical protein LG3211_4329 [Lysobacter gummosus]